MRYIAALACVLAGIAGSWALQGLPLANLSLVFLTVVMVVAARWGSGPSLFAAVLSFLAYNFLFTPPYFTFRVQNRGDVATLLFFLAMAALTGHLAARMRGEIRNRQAALARISELLDFSRRIASATKAGEVLAALCQHLQEILKRPVAVALAKGSGDDEAHTTGVEALPHDILEAVVNGSYRKPADGREHWTVIPLNGAREVIGAVGILDWLPEPAQSELVESLCRQAGVAVERTLLVKDLEEARIESQAEQLRSALLSSVSHDLRTPLASIIGSTSSLLEYGDSFSGEDRHRLLNAVLAESQRLDRYIQNLLDMTRLGQGKIPLRRDWADLGDIITAARERLGTSLDGFNLDVSIDGGVELLFVHGAFLEQVLVNLLDNAARYSVPGAVIGIHSWPEGNELIIDVTDQGPGIPTEDRERVFDMFFRGSQPDRSSQGTGLGLAICRGLIGAHGGRIDALPGKDGSGTCIRITLPSTAFEQPGGSAS